MAKIKISSKNQIVIPSEVRERLKLKKGASISIYAVDETHAIITKHPAKKGYAESMVGLGKEIWDELGGVDKYIEEERNSWGDR
jgi:AbrB family looped-hinge helix DNA binding protein